MAVYLGKEWQLKLEREAGVISTDSLVSWEFTLYPVDSMESFDGTTWKNYI